MRIRSYVVRRVHWLLLPALCGAIAMACDLLGRDNEHVGTSLSALSVGTNAQVVGDNMHYASVVPVKNPSGTSQWLVVYDNLSSAQPSAFNTHSDQYNAVGWALSTDISGAAWTAYEPDAGWEESNWIPPGTPSDGHSFAGWRGDPTVTTIGDPPDGTRAMLVAAVGTTNSVSDIASLMSTNGGVSWGSPTYITQQQEAGGTTGAGDVDQPLITSNHGTPYSTFAAWSSGIGSATTLKSWITSINNTTYEASSSSSAAGTWDSSSSTGNANSPKQIPFGSVVRPKIAVTSMPCGGTTHEIVWVAWTTALQGRVCGLGTSTITTKWYLTAFDNTANSWYSSEVWIDTDMAWPNCIATGSGTSNIWNSDEATPAIVAAGPVAAVAHNRSTAIGTRIQVDQFRLTCTDAGLSTITLIRSDLAPDPCYIAGYGPWCPASDGGARGGNGPDGGNVTNDQWGPAMALYGARLFITWYDTSGDLSNTNVRINGTADGLTNNPFFSGSSPLIFAVSTTSDAGQQVPWPINTGAWWDYQGIATDSTSSTLLAAWGGDGRLVDASAGPSGVWASQLTP